MREFHSVSKPIGIRQKILFVHCIRKKYQLPRVVRMTMEHIFGKEQSKKIFKVAFGETKTKVISARVCKVDASGSLHVNERERRRERVPPIKKINIKSNDVFEPFRERSESKANPKFSHVTAYFKSFHLLLEGRSSITK